MLRTRVEPNSRPADPDKIAADARRWWAIMSVDRDVADNLAAFSAWLDADPTHAAAFEVLCKKQDRKAAWSSRLLARFIGGRRRWIEAVAIAGLACLLVLGTTAPHPDVSVPAGVWESRAPGDGSDLQFGPGARAWVDFSGQQRSIRLDAGSVIVEAAKDPNRPMIVTTEHGSVRVVGTRFVVIVDATGTEVTVTRGKVEVKPAEAAATATALIAAQRVRVTSAEAARHPVSIADTEEVRGGWRTFDAAPLADLASAIGTETGQRVVVLPSADSHAGRVSGRFRVRDGQATLALLEQAYGVRHADAPFGVTILY